jgi:hypothetical protein
LLNRGHNVTDSTLSGFADAADWISVTSENWRVTRALVERCCTQIGYLLVGIDPARHASLLTAAAAAAALERTG